MAGIDGTDNPQIIEHLSKSLNLTPYDVKWIPCSSRFVMLGENARATGALHVYELSKGEMKLVKQVEKPKQFKCGTFGASSIEDRYLATGDFEGRVGIWDLERTEVPIWSTKGHDVIINCIDGCGGTVGAGAPELVTGSRDGSVKVWDPRQRDAQVADFSPDADGEVRDCWSVAFGNAYNGEERCIAAGYDNGDVKLFDLRTMTERWSDNVKNGICGVEFDRKDIQMNKLQVTTLESRFRIYDMRTQHPQEGHAYLLTKNPQTTIWAAKHVPQNRDLVMTCGGDGTAYLYKYHYPAERFTTDSSTGHRRGVAGSVELLNNRKLSDQPIGAFDWSSDKQGLFVCASFDQMIRVGVVTKLAKH